MRKTFSVGWENVTTLRYSFCYNRFVAFLSLPFLTMLVVFQYNERGQLPYMPAFHSYWQPVQVHMKITRNYDIRNNLSKSTLYYDYSKREILTIRNQCICRRKKVHAIVVSFAIVAVFPCMILKWNTVVAILGLRLFVNRIFLFKVTQIPTVMSNL